MMVVLPWQHKVVILPNFLCSLYKTQMSVTRTLKIVLIYTFAEEKQNTSKMLRLYMVVDRLTFGLPW